MIPPTLQPLRSSILRGKLSAVDECEDRRIFKKCLRCSYTYSREGLRGAGGAFLANAFANAPVDIG